MDVLKMSYFDAAKAIPFMVTAFADLIVWEHNENTNLTDGVMMLKFKNEDIKCLEADNLKFFWNDLSEDWFIKDNKLETAQFEKAVAKYGELAFDECFGYTPLLKDGGTKKLANLSKMKTLEHIAYIAEKTDSLKYP